MVGCPSFACPPMAGHRLYSSSGTTVCLPQPLKQNGLLLVIHKTGGALSPPDKIGG
jgi:hypothetical protein